MNNKLRLAGQEDSLRIPSGSHSAEDDELMLRHLGWWMEFVEFTPGARLSVWRRERESIGHWWRRGKGRYDKWRLASIFPLEAVGERQSLQILKFKLQSESEEAAAFIRIAHWQCLGRRLSSSRTTLQRRLIRWWRTMINKGMKLIKLKWITIINN